MLAERLLQLLLCEISEAYDLFHPVNEMLLDVELSLDLGLSLIAELLEPSDEFLLLVVDYRLKLFEFLNQFLLQLLEVPLYILDIKLLMVNESLCAMFMLGHFLLLLSHCVVHHPRCQT